MGLRECLAMIQVGAFLNEKKMHCVKGIFFFLKVILEEFTEVLSGNMHFGKRSLAKPCVVKREHGNISRWLFLACVKLLFLRDFDSSWTAEFIFLFCL